MMVNSPSQDFLNPEILKPYMFKTQITGQTNILLPEKYLTIDADNIYQNLVRSALLYSDEIPSSNFDEYKIEMVKTKQQILPKQLFNQTTIYAYAGNTKTGYKASFPGPTILAKKDRPVKIKWINNILGPHILPVDLNYPFISQQAFINQVPVVPHAHGIAVKSSSDGQPESYWTSSGKKSQMYKTQQPCAPNQAVYIYPNQQQAGNNWYHDHAMGITRLNVYAGLAGLYKIIDPNSLNERQIIENHGKQVSEYNTKFLVVTDKTFKQDGELYYPAESMNPSFTSWVPQFFGNTMLVNGVLWPVLKLNKGTHRIVLLNACQSRYLNIYFEKKHGQRLPIKMLRVDSDFYQNQVIVDEILATIATRFQFIIDLIQEDDEIIIKNNAPTPYPMGDQTTDQFTTQVMKIKIIDEVKQSKSNSLKIQKKNQTNQVRIQKNPTNKVSTPNRKYPLFDQGQKVYTTLFQVFNNDGQMQGMFIDGLSMMNGMECLNSTYKAGKTYDIYFINLTPDTHPIHFHLINMQKVKQFPINIAVYQQAYFELNGGRPSKYGFSSVHNVINPQQFRIGNDILADEIQKVFRDTIDVHPDHVTVIRVKFAKNDGTQFHSFDIRGQRYVMHCHILQHEDNEMMKYFCLE